MLYTEVHFEMWTSIIWFQLSNLRLWHFSRKYQLRLPNMWGFFWWTLTGLQGQRSPVAQVTESRTHFRVSMEWVRSHTNRLKCRGSTVNQLLRNGSLIWSCIQYQKFDFSTNVDKSEGHPICIKDPKHSQGSILHRRKQDAWNLGQDRTCNSRHNG